MCTSIIKSLNIQIMGNYSQNRRCFPECIWKRLRKTELLHNEHGKEALYQEVLLFAPNSSMFPNNCFFLSLVELIIISILLFIYLPFIYLLCMFSSFTFWQLQHIFHKFIEGQKHINVQYPYFSILPYFLPSEHFSVFSTD